MKIAVLSENTQGHSSCGVEHGLCLYVETAGHRLLMDTGASDLFLKNASVLNVDVSLVDTVILSHGHNDHGGGLPFFMKVNDHAVIHAQASAFADYYSLHDCPKFIGLDPELSGSSRIVKADGSFRIDDELEIMAAIRDYVPVPTANGTLKVKIGERLVQDDFRHEQCLVITGESGKVLLSGCAHHGIMNILDNFRKTYGADPHAVISGFHLRKKTAYTEADIAEIKTLAEELNKHDTVFYTCHCTGDEAYLTMREIMGEKLRYLRCGDVLFI